MSSPRPCPCPFPGGHLWSMARLRDGRQQCLWCLAVRYLRIVKTRSECKRS
jgi:hypothetical protein